ncbi:MAG: hypothetical protein KAH12_09090 [Anaerolineales bacterium]|nr:hypothetical protein [Anaerolineales bacterium]
MFSATPIFKKFDCPQPCGLAFSTRTRSSIDRALAHMVPGAQENAASVMDEITTLVSLPPDLIAPR